METTEIATLPVTGWELRTVPAMDAMLITFSYLSHAMQTPAEAVTDRNYIFHTHQARELAERILAALAKLESNGFQPVPGPKH